MSDGPGRQASGLRVDHISLVDFRSYPAAELDLAPGFNAVLGPNGRGKTNLLEAIAYVSRLDSFRGVPAEALVRSGAAAAVIRARIDHAGREILVEAEIPTRGRPRVLANRQRVARRADLLSDYQVSVFTPDDLALVKDGPAIRRDFLDDLLISMHPRNDAVRTEFERVLRQRNALLKQVGGRLGPEAALTLDVWDERLAACGQRLGELRVGAIERLAHVVTEAYRSLAGVDVEVSLSYESGWLDHGLAAALSAGRRDDVRRGLSLVGPHRDDLWLGVGGMFARHRASQGEQRSLAFALRLAAHRVVTETIGSAPTLLLDDVFSELDPSRSAALLRSLPPGQTVLTSAIGLPAGAEPERVFEFVGDDAVPRRADR